MKQTVSQIAYQQLSALFLLVYFGEVLASRLGHLVSSVERQFWLWYIAAAVLSWLPWRLYMALAVSLPVALAAVYLLRPQSGLVQDLATWVLLAVLAAALRAAAIMFKNEHPTT